MTSGKYKTIAVVFLVAMLARGALLCSTLHHEEVLLQPDSRIYISLARGLMEHGSLCQPQRPGQPNVERMPGYPLVLATLFWIFGNGLAAVAVIQILVDCISCVLIVRLAETLSEGAGLLSGVLAALNGGMISYAHFILNDSLFVFCFLLFLLALFRLLREGQWRWAAALGFTAGLAAMVRPVIVYLPFVIAPFLFALLLRRGHVSWVLAAAKVLLMVSLFLFCLSPWVIRNHIHYGRLKWSAQSGEHLLQYVVPFVWQYSKGIPFLEGMKKTSAEFVERASRSGLDLQKSSPFEISDFQVAMAMEYLESEPRGAILKAWVYGAAKNLFSPSIVDLSYLLQVERPHFFHTQGTTTLERAWHFVKGMKGWFGWALVGSLIGLVLLRVLQAWGVLQVMRSKPWEGVLLLLIIGYFLLVSGPVGYAKYRLPFEPILVILSAIGIGDLYARWIRKAGSHRRLS